MNGVEILDTATYKITELSNQVASALAIVLIAILCSIIAVAILCFSCSEDDVRYSTLKCSLLTIFAASSPLWGLLIGFLISHNCIQERIVVGETYVYQCTISDEVSFNDLAARYEVIGHQGKIYKIRETVMFDEPIPEEEYNEPIPEKEAEQE